MLNPRHLIAILSVAVLMLTTSCGSSRTVTASRNADDIYTPAPSSHSRPSSPDPKGLHPEQAALLREARAWLGTPYKYGGNDRDGLDCSGFVVRVYNDALGIKLPRTSREQSTFCTPVKKSDLVPGDLVFFATTKGSSAVSHVGIYIGDGKMIHSSSSKGVVESDLSLPYYTKAYACGGYVEQLHAMLKPSAPKATPNPVAPPAEVATVSATDPDFREAVLNSLSIKDITE